jgi:WhiB family redox-sensing transcriptional regulator
VSGYLGVPQYRWRPRLSIAWQEQAACKTTDPEAFFPNKGDRQTLIAAKRVCKSCPVVADCLEYALLAPEWAGVWGDTSERQRRDIVRLGKKRSTA